MTVISETEVVKACKTLFGSDVDISRHFLYYSVQPSGVKSAYRKKAKENHPDFFARDPLPVQQQQTVLFREILQAYDTLNLFFKQREQGLWRWAGKGADKPSRKKKETGPAPSAAASSPKTKSDVYYKGDVPNRRLQFGQYLYYRGKIPFEALIKALVWQRKQRPTIGDIALQWGMLDREGVDKIFSQCGKARLFGEKAVELGLLTVFQVNTILLYQRSQQGRLGNYFVQNNTLSREELERLAADLKEHNARVLSQSAARKFNQPQYA